MGLRPGNSTAPKADFYFSSRRQPLLRGFFKLVFLINVQGTEPMVIFINRGKSLATVCNRCGPVVYIPVSLNIFTTGLNRLFVEPFQRENRI